MVIQATQPGADLTAPTARTRVACGASSYHGPASTSPGGGLPLGLETARDVPVWNFHGAMDPVVPIEMSVGMVRALRNAGGDVRFTVYPDAGHDSWTETYANPEVYAWLLSHRLSDRE